jgi:hypothetical protein
LPPMRFASGTNTSVKLSSAVSHPWKPIFSSFLLVEALHAVLEDQQAEGIRAVALAGLHERDDHVGGLPEEMNVFAPLTR